MNIREKKERKKISDAFLHEIWAVEQDMANIAVNFINVKSAGD